MLGVIFEWVFCGGFIYWWYNKIIGDRRNDE